MFLTPDLWMLFIVPAVLGLFGLRFTRGRLPANRMVFGLIATVLWSAYQAAQCIRAFWSDGATRAILFALAAAIFPPVAAGVGGLAIGASRRIGLVVAIPLVLAIAMLMTWLGWFVAFMIIPVVNASG